MTKKKPLSEHKKDGRKPIPDELKHRWTLVEIMLRCGAEDTRECWDNYRTRNGETPSTEHLRRYVAVNHGGERRLLRHLAWELAFDEPVPPGKKLVMAVCDNPRCHNPHHAKAMSEKQKTKRAASNGSFSSLVRRAAVAKGRRATAPKLCIEVARKIRADVRKLKDEPWKDYGISASMYKRIRANRAWIEYEALGFFARLAA